MARKSKHNKSEPFSLEVSNAIRHHCGEALALESKRDIAFDDRDNAISQKHEALEQHGEESSEYADACKAHSRAIEDIDDLSTRIKWHTKSALQYSQKADAPDLEILYEMPIEPPAPKKAAKPKDEDVKGQKQIGQVDVPVGEQQHLEADPSNLDLAGPLLAKLRKAGVTKVAQLFHILDDEKRDLRDELSLNENQASELKKALKGYRKRHLRAELESSRS